MHFYRSSQFWREGADLFFHVLSVMSSGHAEFFILDLLWIKQSEEEEMWGQLCLEVQMSLLGCSQVDRGA